jgi:hypothetical protein
MILLFNFLEGFHRLSSVFQLCIHLTLHIPCFPNPSSASPFPDPYCRLCLGNIALLCTFAHVTIFALYRLDMNYLPVFIHNTVQSGAPLSVKYVSHCILTALCVCVYILYIACVCVLDWNLSLFMLIKCLSCFDICNADIIMLFWYSCTGNVCCARVNFESLLVFTGVGDISKQDIY